MILYKKTFPLGKGASFSHYINALRKAYFPNFVLTIDKMPPTENYRAQIFFVASYWRSGWRNGYYERVFLKECAIHYSIGERYFTLQASPKTGNLLLASLQVLFAILLIVYAIFALFTNSGMSLNNILGFAIGIIIMLAPLLLTYLQDKNLLDKVGSIGNDLGRT